MNLPLTGGANTIKNEVSFMFYKGSLMQNCTHASKSTASRGGLTIK